MTMGQRILRARQEAGLSQRQLAGEEITRNMLSSLEHDAAKPSITTLQYLSERLCKPISYFLGEDLPQVAGCDDLADARRAYKAGEFRRCLDIMSSETPGEVLSWEWSFLKLLAALDLAERSIGDGRLPYARELLAQTENAQEHPYFTPELARKRQILLVRCGLANPDTIPGEDQILLLRAMADPAEGERFLNAALDRDNPHWHAAMGECCFARGQYRQAAAHFHQAEEVMDLRERLESCYRELEDYKMAYYYAKK